MTCYRGNQFYTNFAGGVWPFLGLFSGPFLTLLNCHPDLEKRRRGGGGGGGGAFHGNVEHDRSIDRPFSLIHPPRRRRRLIERWS